MNTKLFFLLIALLLACFALSATNVCATTITSRSGLVYGEDPISVQLSAQRSQEHSHQPTIRTLASAFNLPNRSPDRSSRLASLSVAAKSAQQRTALTFADRVSYQRAIEEVYRRHRIWPKERPDSKPSLDAVMTQAQLERKVEDYLRDSQALEDYWQRPITSEQLQAEMDRMAQHTKQPEVLRELFQALGSDPFVIAECLARPLLTQRLVTDLNKEDRMKLTRVAWLKQPLQPFVAHAGTQAALTIAALNANYTLPTISAGTDCINDTWTATNTANAPDGRAGHTAVWTGSEMIVWGGLNVNDTPLNTGGRYNPSTDSWTATSTTNAPTARGFHTAVWTGSEMIIWGGFDGTYLNTGSRYNPVTDSWTATSVTNAPTARADHTAVWTGSEMIVWGGSCGLHCGSGNTGGRYNPSTDSWTATTTNNAPTGRVYHTAVWTGSDMIAWGGFDGNFDLNTGGRYNPSTDSWTATTTSNAPTGRSGHTAVWAAGSDMIVWGGVNGSSELNTGGRYNAVTDSWTATSVTNAPAARAGHTAVWTGSEMIVWGGGTQNMLFNTGGRYCAQSAPMAQSAFSRKTHGAAGTFDIDMPLTGTSGVECRSGGATHDYSLVVTFSGNVTVTGMPQAQVIMGTGCVGSGGTCDPNGTVTVSGNVVTVPLTNIADVQVINVQINGVNGASDEPAVNVNIPMGFLTGDVNGNRAVNASDVALTKSQVGQNVGSGNFREDVNTSGTITATDVTIVKSDVGHSLPPQP
ncbi:MAG: dockerin type I domain-containing protein [Chthoniobacterales bacterium]